MALEELAKNSCEFPAFSTLDDLAAQRQRNERMPAVLGDLLSAAKEADLAARTAPNPWTAVRRRHETGRAVLETINVVVEDRAYSRAGQRSHGSEWCAALAAWADGSARSGYVGRPTALDASASKYSVVAKGPV
ncbi:hypothetical protein ACQPYK_24655 [Streptosporangium sp. CA-135522]|uniref:hypothetical protein n=1 Tax=Streptosporangium sp. CA-135522 TaxID=3240072 RepID=UPI003D8C8EBB